MVGRLHFLTDMLWVKLATLAFHFLLCMAKCMAMLALNLASLLL